MLGVTVISTPLSAIVFVLLHDGAPPIDPAKFHQVIGSIQYISLTRPNIFFVVNELSQFMHRLTTNIWSAIKKVLRYLKRAIHFWLPSL